MMLFFETGRQAAGFLAAVPIGVLAAAFLRCGHACGIWRLAADLLLMALAGMVLIFLLVFLRDGTLRIYHLLGVLCGAFFYLHVQRSVCRVMRRMFSKKKPPRQESVR